jgi:hypothetical protein
MTSNSSFHSTESQEIAHEQAACQRKGEGYKQGDYNRLLVPLAFTLCGDDAF